MLPIIFVCLGVRTLIAWLAWRWKDTHLSAMGFVALIPALGFLYLYLSDGRQTGFEVQSDDKIVWWSNWRPVHGLLWGLFAVTAIGHWTGAWMFLALDAGLGSLIFVNKYWV
jgi:hypothetical protein